jgi:hypothetical protein
MTIRSGCIRRCRPEIHGVGSGQSERTTRIAFAHNIDHHTRLGKLIIIALVFLRRTIWFGNMMRVLW